MAIHHLIGGIPAGGIEDFLLISEHLESDPADTQNRIGEIGTGLRYYITDFHLETGCALYFCIAPETCAGEARYRIWVEDDAGCHFGYGEIYDAFLTRCEESARIFMDIP